MILLWNFVNFIMRDVPVTLTVPVPLSMSAMMIMMMLSGHILSCLVLFTFTFHIKERFCSVQSFEMMGRTEIYKIYKHWALRRANLKRRKVKKKNHFTKFILNRFLMWLWNWLKFEILKDYDNFKYLYGVSISNSRSFQVSNNSQVISFYFPGLSISSRSRRLRVCD